jgi:non-ribosomal peptide synthetase component F
VSAIAERFARIVARYPDFTAVRSGRRELTYRQLDTLAGRLARHVAACCADEERTVALALDHGVDLCLGALACLKAGRVFVPVDRREPPERLRRILADADSALLLAGGEPAAGVPDGIDVLNIHDVPSAPLPLSSTLRRRSDDGLPFAAPRWRCEGRDGRPRRGDDWVTGHNGSMVPVAG